MSNICVIFFKIICECLALNKSFIYSIFLGLNVGVGAERIYCNNEFTAATDVCTGSAKEWACQQSGAQAAIFLTDEFNYLLQQIWGENE